MGGRVVGMSADGVPVREYELRNARGNFVRVLSYGATVTHWCVADGGGITRDIVLGRDAFQGYVDDAYAAANPYFGCVVGRFANRCVFWSVLWCCGCRSLTIGIGIGRIGKGRYELDGKSYTLPTNNGPNCLHGGIKGTFFY